jgi:hypothetical protein
MSTCCEHSTYLLRAQHVPVHPGVHPSIPSYSLGILLIIGGGRATTRTDWAAAPIQRVELPRHASRVAACAWCFLLLEAEPMSRRAPLAYGSSEVSKAVIAVPAAGLFVAVVPTNGQGPTAWYGRAIHISACRQPIGDSLDEHE